MQKEEINKFIKEDGKPPGKRAFAILDNTYN